MRTSCAWCIAAVALLAGPARADTCPAPPGGSEKLASADARDRIEFLRARMDAQARYARTWKWTWVGIGSFTTVASAAQAVGWAAVGDERKRDANVVDDLVVSGFSVVTPIFALLFSPRVERDAPVMDELLRQTGGGAAGTCLVLARIEELFAKDAQEEAFDTGWFTQLAAVVGLSAMFGILMAEAALASDPVVRDVHEKNAGLNTAAGIFLTEMQILTTPTGAVSAYRRYLKGDLPRKSIAFSVVPLVATPGLALKVTF